MSISIYTVPSSTIRDYFFWVKKQIILYVLLMLGITPVLSQHRFQKAYGSTGNELGRGITRDNYGNLILLNQVDLGTETDFGIMVLSNSGVLMSSFHYSIPSNQEPYALEKTSDGGFLIGGTDYGDIKSRTFLCKINENLDVEWLRFIKTQSDMYCAMITEDNQGNIYLNSVSKPNNLADNALTKFSSSGALIWKRTFGIDQNDHIFDIHFSEDGTLNCFGDIWDGGSHLILIRMSPDGVVLRQQSLFHPFENYHYYPMEVIDLENGEFIITGCDLVSSKSVLIKMDENLQPVWSQLTGGTASSGNIDLYLESGYFANGNVYLIGNTSLNGGDIIIVSMNTDGGINWSKAYGGSLLEKTDRTAHRVIYADDDKVYFCGRTQSFGAGSNDIYLTCAGIDGNSGCYEQDISIHKITPLYEPYEIDIIKSFNVDILIGSAQKQPANWLITETMCPTALQADFTANQQNICAGAGVNFTDLTNNLPTSWNWIFEGGTPASSVLQNPGNIVYFNPGSFKVTLMVSSGSEYDTIVRENYIQAAPLPQVNLGNDLCMPSEGLLPLFAGEGFIDYQWSNGISGSSWIYAVEPGIYWVTVTNQFGCVNTDSIEIYPGLDTLPDLGPDQSICDGQTISLNPGTAYYSYLWSDGSSADHLDVATPGIYWVKVSNEWGCEASDSITVTYGLNPVLNLGEDLMLCQLSNTVLDAGTGYSSYLWSNGSSAREISPAEFGTYWVRVTDLNGCQGSDTILIEQKFLNIDIGDTLTACEGEIISVDAGNSFGQYQWSNGGTTSLIEISDPGKYWIRVTDENQCEGSDTIVVLFSDLPEFERINRLSAGYIQVSASGGTAPYMYSDNGLSYQNSGEFQTTGVDFQRFFIRDARGCMSDSLVYLGEVDLIIPNFFTPNDDFNHDIWEIDGIQAYPDAVIRIFDRFGKLIMTYEGTNAGWDGKINGKEVPSDTYWYQITFPAYTKKPITGNVTLIR